MWGSAWNSNMEILEIFKSKVLTHRGLCRMKWVISRDLLSARQDARNHSVTYRQRLTDHPNSLAKSLFQRPNYNRRLKRYCPADPTTKFNWYSATPPQTVPNRLWLRLSRRCITWCISFLPLIVTVNTIAECLRTDCNILGDYIQGETGGTDQTSGGCSLC